MADENQLAADWQLLDPQQIPLDQIRNLIAVIVAVAIGIGVAIPLIVTALASGSPGWVALILCVAVLFVIAALFFLAIYWPRLKYRNTQWLITGSCLEIRRGVLWKHYISVPLARVQHADVSQGPLQHHFELGTLTVHTAGTQNASVALEGLNHTAAIQLRDSIIRQRKAIDVV
jgi:membrane protein YdbS with pleckstrin-like domain